LLFSSTNFLILFINTCLSKLRAWSLIFFASKSRVSNFSIAELRDVTVCCSKNIPVSQAITVSNAHHFQYAITGVQPSIASTGTSQKSSSGGKRNAFVFAKYCLVSSLGIESFHSILLFDFDLSSL